MLGEVLLSAETNANNSAFAAEVENAGVALVVLAVDLSLDTWVSTFKGPFGGGFCAGRTSTVLQIYTTSVIGAFAL